MDNDPIVHDLLNAGVRRLIDRALRSINDPDHIYLELTDTQMMTDEFETREFCMSKVSKSNPNEGWEEIHTGEQFILVRTQEGWRVKDTDRNFIVPAALYPLTPEGKKEAQSFIDMMNTDPMEGMEFDLGDSMFTAKWENQVKDNMRKMGRRADIPDNVIDLGDKKKKRRKNDPLEIDLSDAKLADDGC